VDWIAPAVVTDEEEEEEVDGVLLSVVVVVVMGVEKGVYERATACAIDFVILSSFFAIAIMFIAVRKYGKEIRK
jgi:hypothetical protein